MGFELTVHRADAFMLKGRKFRLEIDGVEVGALRRGAHVTAALTEGEHRVRVFVGSAASKSATSRVMTVIAGSTGAASLVARPSDLDVDAQTGRRARPDRFAIEIVDGDDVSRVGPTFLQMYRSRPPSLGAPARSPAQRVWWLAGLTLALAGFALLPLVHNGVGIVFLGAAAVIFVALQVDYLRWRKRR